MIRIPLVTEDAAPPEVSALYDVLKAEFKKVPNLFATAAHYPAAMKPLLELFDALYNQSDLDPRLLEFVVIKIAYGYQSHYCLTLHKAFALERGVSNADIKAMEDRANWDAFPPAERALLEFTEQFQKEPLDVSDELFAGMRRHYSEGQIVNLTMLMGVASLFGQMANALQIPVDSFIGAAAGESTP